MQPIIEFLEQRAHLSVTLDGDVLRIEGTDARDVIKMRDTGQRLLVIQNKRGTGFASAAIRRIVVTGRGGFDSINLGNVTQPSYVTGDDGDDHLIGGAGKDRIYGGNGADRIDGLAGNDSLFGGGGKDTISGGNGNDSIVGGTGIDEMNGLAGDDFFLAEDRYVDVVNGGAGTDEAKMDLLLGESGDITIDVETQHD